MNRAVMCVTLAACQNAAEFLSMQWHSGHTPVAPENFPGKFIYGNIRTAAL